MNLPTNIPDEDVDFRAGEVIYENPLVKDWGKFSIISSISFYLYQAVYWPFLQLYKTHIPSKDMLFSRTDSFRLFSVYEFDTLSFSPMFIGVVLGMTFLIHFKNLKMLTRNFPIKMQYNEKKDLLFITFFDELGIIREEIFELSNVERVVKNDKSNLTFSDNESGWAAFKCLSKKQYLVSKSNFMLLNQSEHEP